MPFVFSPEKINKKWRSFLRGPAAVRRTERHYRTRHFQQRTRIPQKAYKKERRRLGGSQDQLCSPPAFGGGEFGGMGISMMHSPDCGRKVSGCHSTSLPIQRDTLMGKGEATTPWAKLTINSISKLDQLKSSFPKPFFCTLCKHDRVGVAARSGCGKGFIHFCIFVIREKRNFYGYFYGSSVPIAVMLILFSSCPWCIWIVAWGNVIQPFLVRLKAEK